MFRLIASSLALSIALSGAANAENFEVQMLNRGETGNMIFEPSFLRLAPGDTVKLALSDKLDGQAANP